MTRVVERSVERVVPEHLPVDGRTPAEAAILRWARRDATWLKFTEDWTERRSAPSGSLWRHDSHGDDR